MNQNNTNRRNGLVAVFLAVSLLSLSLFSGIAAADDDDVNTATQTPRVIIAPYSWVMDMSGSVGINDVAIPLGPRFMGNDTTLVSPYFGVRIEDPMGKMNGTQRIVQGMKKNWRDPAVGVIIQGPVWRRFDYVVKLDASGFNVDGDNYRSALALLRYTFDPAWSVAAGYRASKFNADPSSANGLAIDLSGSGPLVGLQYSF